MNRTPLIRQLSTIAAITGLAKGIIRQWETPLLRAKISDELRTLTRWVTNDGRLADSDILASLFAEDAIPLLLSLPNEFWFWKIVERAGMLDDASAKVSRAAVENAIWHWRVEASKEFDLHKKVSDLTSAERTLRLSFGVVIWRRANDGHFELVMNPIFDMSRDNDNSEQWCHPRLRKLPRPEKILPMRKLCEIAFVAARALNEEGKTSTVKPTNPTNADMTALAKQVLGVENLADEAVLPALIEQKAIEKLLELPNLYWFWTILWQAAFDEAVGASKLSFTAVSRTIGTFYLPENK